jgi:hypothetical protein
MDWLVTFKGDLAPSAMRAILERIGATHLDDIDPLPSDGDQVVEVQGPRDLPDRAAAVPEIRAVHPSSEMSLY